MLAAYQRAKLNASEPGSRMRAEAAELLSDCVTNKVRPLWVIYKTCLSRNRISNRCQFDGVNASQPIEARVNFGIPKKAPISTNAV